MPTQDPVYHFKPEPEFWWLLAVTAGGVIATAIATQGAIPPNDMRAWIIGVGAAVVRAVGGVVLSHFASPRPT